ncbi:Lanthionine synthetase C family protein [Parafrankia sp. EAN1pec]|uniref:lanthionine synthetase C family protein n=1 Tax=Parafrankia sp. (strain EAN1pec) TaxID=298653 RepID=UPI0000544788|nr:Lanthionine synthetase C family protein [Frankia sp. EAN1pec]
MTVVIDTRVRAATVATRLADALTVPPPPEPDGDRSPSSPRWQGQSLAEGAAGIAVLHGVRARAHAGEWATVDAWLTAAAREDLSVGPGAGLWFGAPALALALTAAAPPGRHLGAARQLHTAVERLTERRLAAAHARIDAGQRPERAEFDLVRGLTGLGAYLATRNPDGEQLRQILTYLVRLTEPLPATDTAGLAAPGWWTIDVPTTAPPGPFADGHADQGMAHGIAGPLALLALTHRRGVIVPGHTDALDRICHWLDTWRQDGPAGPWWPERITASELLTGRAAQPGPGRASWCYGTPGLARAQQLAAVALADTTRQQRAEAALAACVTDPAQLARFVDPALCHGWAGLVATVRCAAADARFYPLDSHLPSLVKQLLDSLDAAQGADWQLPGLIEGTAGIAAVLHAVATNTTTAWESALLLDLPPAWPAGDRGAEA